MSRLCNVCVCGYMYSHSEKIFLLFLFWMISQLVTCTSARFVTIFSLFSFWHQVRRWSFVRRRMKYIWMFFFEGGGLSFYWCISFARYAIYWYKRLEAKESFGMENISENGFGEEMKGNWWHGGFLFHRIKRGQSLFLTIHLCRDFFGGGHFFLRET